MAVQLRSEIDDKYKWKLNKIYSTDEDWEEEFKNLKVESPKLQEFSGKLNDKEEILKYFKFSEKVSRNAEKLYVYAHMKCDEDTTTQKYQGMMNRIDGFMADLGSYASFFVPEILSLQDGFIEGLLRDDNRFKQYDF